MNDVYTMPALAAWGQAINYSAKYPTEDEYYARAKIFCAIAMRERFERHAATSQEWLLHGRTAQWHFDDERNVEVHRYERSIEHARLVLEIVTNSLLQFPDDRITECISWERKHLEGLAREQRSGAAQDDKEKAVKRKKAKLAAASRRKNRK